MATGALKNNGGSDYTLKPGQPSCWITVDNISVYIVRGDAGVHISTFPLEKEMEPELGVMTTYFDEVDA